MTKERTCKPIYVENFSSERAGTKISFPADEIVISFQADIKKRLLKEGFKLSETKSDSIVISGEFVMIDEGNQFLRWFIGPFGVGATSLEIEGVITEDGKKQKDFTFSRKGRGGLFGGKGRSLLVNNAVGISKEIVRLLD